LRDSQKDTLSVTDAQTLFSVEVKLPGCSPCGASNDH
jgi:hypothetical protein